MVLWGADFCLVKRTGPGDCTSRQQQEPLGSRAVAALQLKPVTRSRRERLRRWGICGSAGSVLATQAGQLQPCTLLCPLTARGCPPICGGLEGGLPREARAGKRTHWSVSFIPSTSSRVTQRLLGNSDLLISLGNGEVILVGT